MYKNLSSNVGLELTLDDTTVFAEPSGFKSDLGPFGHIREYRKAGSRLAKVYPGSQTWSGEEEWTILGRAIRDRRTLIIPEILDTRPKR